MRVERIDGLSKFRELEEEWDGLLSLSEANTIFLTWEWLFAWWQIYGAEKELYILLVRDQDKLVGIAPFYLEKKKSALTVPYKRLRFLGCEHVGSDYLDFILHQEKRQAALEAILNYLAARREDWDIITLQDILASSFTVDAVRKYWNKQVRFISRLSQTCPFMKLPGSWEEFLQNIGARTRKNIRQAQRRFDSEPFRYEVVDGGEKVSSAIENIMALNQERSENKHILSPFRNPKFQKFHYELVQLLANKKNAKFYFIHENGNTVAAKYIYSHGKKRYGYITAIKEEFARLSPGVGLLAHCIEEAISEGIEEFDLLRGREQWKTHWTKDQRYTLTFEIYNKKLLVSLKYLVTNLNFKSRELIKKYAHRKN